MTPDPTRQTSVADFPFYNGQPVALSGRQWLVLLLAVAAAYGALYLPLWAGGPRTGSWGALATSIALPVLPLLALRAVVGPRWQVLFRPLRGRDVVLAIGLVLFNIVVTLAVALVVSHAFGAVPNPVFKALARMDAMQQLAFFARIIPQLIGEEVITVLPFLALLAWFTGPLHMPRGRAVALAWLLSSLLFGALHLPTYGWNVAQSLLVIGASRAVLWLAYLHTRNLSVAALAHILNDGLLFGAVVLLGSFLD